MRPSLLLDFAKTKMLDKRITFTRNSKAGYFDRNGVYRMAAAGEPRFDFDPITGACNGLLIEEQRTNLLTYSEQFDNAAWNKLNSTVISNTVAAPDGTLTADKLVEDASSNTHLLEQIATVSSGTSYTFSIFVRAAERTSVLVQMYVGLSAGVVVNLTNGNTTNSGSPISVSAVSVGGGWYRVSVTATSTVTGTGYFDVYPYNGSTTNYTGDGTSGIHIWGAQLEAGSFPTSYIPSTINFTGRASAGTYIGSDGLIKTAASGEARLNYNPLNLNLAPKLLLEEARTNAVLNGVAQCGGNQTSASVGTAVGPDGQLATKVIPTAGSVSYAGSGNLSVQYFANNTTAGQTTDYSFSGYFAGFGPKNYQPYIVITASSNPGDELYALARFDTSTGLFTGLTLGTGFSSLSAPKAVMMPTGMWYVTWTVRYTQQSVLRTIVYSYLHIHNEGGLSIYTADGVSGIQRACHQFEVGSYPTSYIPTTTTQVTRVADTSTSAQTTRTADVASMTETNFSSWYRQDEGTFVCSGDSANVDTASSAAVAAFKDSNNYQRIRIGGTYSDITAVSGGVTQVHTSGIAFAQGKAVTTAMAYKLNDYAQSSNGGAVETDASATLPVGIDTLNIGAATSGSNVLNGHISRLAYYPKRLTNTELQALTA